MTTTRQQEDHRASFPVVRYLCIDYACVALRRRTGCPTQRKQRGVTAPLFYFHMYP